MTLDSVTIIIRSVGERTESLCRKLILDQGVSRESVFVIKKAPFSKAMEVGLEIGRAQKRPWTFCVDADLLLRPESIRNMIKNAERQPSNVCEIQGFILDKFFGGARMGGVHVYRTALLDRVINSIPPEGKNIRPETHALNAMHEAGYPWLTVKELVGLHDFEQAYKDIFRKCYVQAHKHLSHTELFIPFWRSKSNQDMDYHIALAGFAEGIKHYGEVFIDKRVDYLQKSMWGIEASPKNEIDLSKWDLDRIESMIHNWVEPEEYWEKYPGGILASSGSDVISSALEQYKWHRSRGSGSVIHSGKQVLSWLLTSAGKKLRNGSTSS
jgi:hypothetical protein